MLMKNKVSCSLYELKGIDKGMQQLKKVFSKQHRIIS